VNHCVAGRGAGCGATTSGSGVDGTGSIGGVEGSSAGGVSFLGGGGAGSAAGGFSTGGATTGGATGGVTGGVVAPGTGSATWPLIIVVLSTVPCSGGWEGCSAAQAALVARTKAARHKASATAGATVFRMSGSTRLVVVLASLKYKPLALPIYSVATRSPGWVQGLHKSYL
jgi:hypothetical protein